MLGWTQARTRVYGAHDQNLESYYEELHHPIKALSKHFSVRWDIYCILDVLSFT